MNKNLQVYWMMLLLGLPFAGVGLITLFLSILPNLFVWQQMKSWPQVSAELQHAELVIDNSGDSSTYSPKARYLYQYQGKHYTGERVSIMEGSDNIGDFQYNLAYVLKEAWRQQQSVPAWVNPSNPTEAVLNRDMHWGMVGFQMIFVVMFGSIGIGLSYSALSNLLRSTPMHKPWRGQRRASPEVSCNSKSGLWLTWGFTLIWNLLSLLGVTAVPRELAAGNFFFLLILVFPLIGIYLLYQAINTTLDWRRFGPLTLRLHPYPCLIGGQFGGTLELPLAYNNQQRFHVRLQCVHSYATGSNKNRHLTETILWQAQGLADSQASALGGTALSLHFDIPDNLPASEPMSTDYRFWRLELAARLPGVNLRREFEIPMFATAEQARSDY
ncbi:DUF3592 domain-containing protein [Cellvibrio sp. UBA7671]|uniref:DUF3592 domain-containing protein n=1 Tax=Cellvibrio sp. UBA7671 TaxID=1946312 RepID=UPI002F35B441